MFQNLIQLNPTTIALEITENAKRCKEFCFIMLVTHPVIDRITTRKRIMELFGMNSDQNN